MKLINKIGSRIKDNAKKNAKLIAIFVVIWVIVVAATLVNNESTLGKASYGNEYSQNVVELNTNTKIKQIVPITENSQYMAIKFATYQRKGNKGEITIKVTGNDSNTVYANKSVNVSTLQDNAYYSFSLDKELLSSNDETLTILVSSNSEEGHGAGIYYSSSHYFENGFLEIDGEEIEGDITVRYLYEDENFDNFSNLVILFTTIFISILILVLLLIEPRLEIMFATIIFLIGLVFTFIITPLSVPDEQIHYESSLQLSNYVIAPDRDHTLIEEDYISYSHYYGHYNVSMAYVRLIEQFNKSLDLDCDLAEMNRDVQYSYAAYFVPQAIGVTIARLLKATVLQTFYAGRIANLLFYCICIYIAVKNTPVNKLLIGIIAGLPIFIQTAASYSYDCFINALSILSLSFLSKWLYEDKQVEIKDFILVFIVCLGLAPAKYVYSLFAFLFVLVPYKRYGSKIKKIIATLILAAPALYQLIPILVPRFVDLFDTLFSTVYAESTDTGYAHELYEIGSNMYSLDYALSHLSETIHLVLFTIRYNIKLWFYGAIGRYLSGQTLILPTSITYAIITLLGISSLRKEDYTPKWYTRVAYVAVCIIMGLFTVGGMLLYWTNIGDYYVQGVQGRYFCPLIPYFFSIFNNKKICITNKIDKYVIFAYLLVIFEVIIYVLSYTFVN